MPELPEVETTRRGIAPHVEGLRVKAVHVRQPRLRWPVPENLNTRLPGQLIDSVQRRAKYLLLRTEAGTVILHLGMSGSLRVVDSNSPPQTHDHIDIVMQSGRSLRLRDPRRFGAVLWCETDPLQHELLKHLGPEPLDESLDGDYLWRRSRGRKLAVKDFLMNSHVVAGLGNIYANESLFEAGVHPARAASRVSSARYERLSDEIKAVLRRAITSGGTTLRDFVREDGAPGYFQQELKVYGRRGLACLSCATEIRERRQGQRSTFYCPRCQH